MVSVDQDEDNRVVKLVVRISVGSAIDFEAFTRGLEALRVQPWHVPQT